MLEREELLHFANEAVDVAIVEVGMLGRYDATNVVRADVAVITNVALDHTDGEDGWRGRVASEKAGIVEAGGVAVLGEGDAEVRTPVEAEGPARIVARDAVDGDGFELVSNELAVGGRLVTVRTPRALHEDLFVRLHGRHQGVNAAVAVAAIEEFFDAPVADDVLAEAFDTLEVPGRLEVVHRAPMVLLDAAHNEPGAAALARAVEEDFGGGSRRYLVMGMQDGRDPVGVFRALHASSYELVVTCTVPTVRALGAEVLRDAAVEAGARAEAMTSLDGALDRVMAEAAEDDLVVVAGSIIVVGLIRELMAEW